MDTNALKKFAQEARNQLRKEVAARLAQVEKADSAELREKDAIVKALDERIKQTSKDRVIEEVAYTWFNRFCALRYMDLNDFNRLKVVSPVNGATQPEILQEAKNGYVDDAYAQKRGQIQAYLNGTQPADNPQQEAYRLLLVSVCNELAESMPFLFERIEDYTELLMPVDLLSSSSILHEVRDAMTPQACEDVEVIGWLYQFYISEKKDEVMARKSAVPSEDIPAVTQLFTPHWIVRYMVENSLGRLWMLNHPESRLAEKMDYYIKPVEEQSDYLHLASPEEIKLCDPACGSGHILTYAFDLLFHIYEEMGYNPGQIPALILQHNLYGIEIDPRAGSLAAFALYMKAFEKDRRFAKREVLPNICVMEDISFTSEEVRLYMEKLGKDLFTQDVWQAFKQFEDATTFGSLIRPAIKNPQVLLEKVQQAQIKDDLFLQETNHKVEKVLEMCNYLASRYEVVVANPPYFGNYCSDFKEYSKEYYPDSKSDTFAMFIERGFELIPETGYNAMVTMQSWMFLSSYEKIREKLLNTVTIECMVHMANMVMGIAFGTAATVWLKKYLPNFSGQYSYVYYEDITADNAPKEFPVRNDRLSTASAADFKKIPGSPIAYWIKGVNNFTYKKLENEFESGGRNKTHNNDLYVRYVWECSQNNMSWIPYSNGGDYRKWYGDEYYLVNWSVNARNFYNSKGGLVNQKYWNKEGITWSLITSAKNSFRIKPAKNMYSSGSPTIFNASSRCDINILGFLNSKVSEYYVEAINPTLNTTVGNILSLPMAVNTEKYNELDILPILVMATYDWDSYEISRDFQCSPLLLASRDFFSKDELPYLDKQWMVDCFYQKENIESISLIQAFTELRKFWRLITNSTNEFELDNNRIYIEAYGLQNELTPEVPLNEITLTCNPHYRYPDSSRTKYTEEERENRLLEDTMKEFLSYAVGSMFGRYSLDKPGLVLANQGETVEDYLQQIPEPTFMPDEDNILPMLDGDWFPDDISNRFRAFLRVTFGDENYEENLSFIEQALGKDIRTYFVRDFYKDHVQTYKKRPIYWLFSSPKGSFNALIYMHRYRPDTVSTLLNKYLREFQSKLRSRKAYLESVESSSSASKSEQVNARKELRQIDGTLLELREYEDKVIYPLAIEQIQIDLDDGVVVNYAKFGNALKNI